MQFIQHPGPSVLDHRSSVHSSQPLTAKARAQSLWPAAVLPPRAVSSLPINDQHSYFSAHTFYSSNLDFQSYCLLSITLHVFIPSTYNWEATIHHDHIPETTLKCFTPLSICCTLLAKPSPGGNPTLCLLCTAPKRPSVVEGNTQLLSDLHLINDHFSRPAALSGNLMSCPKSITFSLVRKTISTLFHLPNILCLFPHWEPSVLSHWSINLSLCQLFTVHSFKFLFHCGNGTTQNKASPFSHQKTFLCLCPCALLWGIQQD